MNSKIKGYPLLVILAIAAFICLVGPLVLIHNCRSGGDSSSSPLKQHASEITVGIGVIIRATARRLIRTGARGVVRTTVSTLTRTTARTLTRRFVRVFTHSALGAVARQESQPAEESPGTSQTEAVRGLRGTWISVVVGFVGLAASFWGVLYLADAEQSEAILTDSGLGLYAACGLAALPLVCYVVLAMLAGRCCGVPVRFSTSLEGLLIQGYFTGAGSYLPMTTDAEYEGTVGQKAGIACTCLVGTYNLHLLFGLLAVVYPHAWLHFASAMFLIFGFVYAFPIRPLEGSCVWDYSKLLWVLVFLPILFSFLAAFPAVLTPIL